jgi:hypothetical protein
MTIRTFQPGDEEAQVRIFNEASAALPKFKPATLDEIRRRCRAADFDPRRRFFALANGEPAAYASFHANGRVSYPWCLPGHEDLAEPLFTQVLQEMKARGLRLAFAAYRADWTAQQAFFQAHGFRPAREMVNFALELVDMPTPAARRTAGVVPARPADAAAILQLCPQAFRVNTPTELERHLFHNPYFSPDAVFVVRDRTSANLLGAGVLIVNPAYADPKQVDSSMPCFRLGAFGTEGMQVKRINGLFSFVARDGNDFNLIGLDLLGHAAFLLRKHDAAALGAQVPSDVPHLLRFYQHHCRRQGSFPVLERELGA